MSVPLCTLTTAGNQNLAQCLATLGLDARPLPGYAFFEAFPEKPVADSPIQAPPQEARLPDVPSVMEVLQDLPKISVLKVQNYSKLSYHSITSLATGPRYVQDTL